jgi:hypothetical protein
MEIVPLEKSSALRSSFSMHAKNDQLDVERLALLAGPRQDGLREATDEWPTDPLRRATRYRRSLVLRQTSNVSRRNALLEIMGRSESTPLDW